jgi:hypothetical protein
MRRAALALATAAVAVAAPRLVLIFLEADSLQVGLGTRKLMLGASGASLALVLTGGGAYLVHAIVRLRRFQGLLSALWIGILTCIAILVTPRLVAGLRLASSPLAQVLSTEPLRWSWSFVAVLAGELVATGCMLAYAAQHQQHENQHQLLAELEQLGRQRNQLQQQLRQAEEELEQQQLARAGRQLALGASGQLTGAAGGQLAAAAPQPTLPAASLPPSAGKASSNGAGPEEPEIACRYGCGYLARNSHAERGHLASCPNRPNRESELPAPPGSSSEPTLQ